MPFSKAEMREELFKFLSLFGKQIAVLYGASDSTWTEKDAIQESPVWKAVSEMYDYGIMGIPTGGLVPRNRINGVHAHIEIFFRAMDTLPMKLFLDAKENAPPRLAVRAVQSAVARMVLDGGGRYTDFGTDEYGLGKDDGDYLTLAEVALLANMDERSVRNAANPKLPDPLKTEQVGKRSLVRPEEARRWLASRKGFVPTQESETSDVQRPLEWNVTLPEELVERIQREAEKEAEKSGVLPSIHFKNKLLSLLAEAIEKKGEQK